MANDPSLVVIVLSLRATMRLSWMWTKAVTAIVTVIVSPVHGFTSSNTTSNECAVGGSATAGTANARANTPSRTGKSSWQSLLFSPSGGTATDHAMHIVPVASGLSWVL